MPRVSVLIPVRDAEPWLDEAMRSVLAQSEADFEAICVDDGSRDASRALLEGYAKVDPRVRVLATAPGEGGLVAALNLALSEARADVIARMDADDRMHPRRLELQLAALAADETLFGVTSLVEAFPDDAIYEGMRAYLDWQNSLLTPEDIARDRFVESTVVHPSVMLRTAPLRERLGGWRELGWPEDWDLFLRAFEADLRIARVPETLTFWRRHAAQSTLTDSRYSEDSLRRLRAAFLARRLAPVVAAGRPVVVLGAGPVGKKLVKALADEGLVVDVLVDVDPRKIGGVVRGGARRWRVVSHAALRERTPRPFAVSAVAGAEARSRVRAELAAWGWREGDDFVVAA